MHDVPRENVRLRPLADADRAWAADLWRERWGGTTMVTRGTTHHVGDLLGFVAAIGTTEGEALVGLVTYRIDGNACEIVSLDSLREGQGIGSALIAAVVEAATAAGATRLWLVTTNDNLAALRFYQKRGFALAALRRGAVTEARRLKPTIPLIGLDGIPLRDEIELELPLGRDGT